MGSEICLMTSEAKPVLANPDVPKTEMVVRLMHS